MGPAGLPPAGSGGLLNACNLAGHQQANNQREKGESFDESRRDDHVRADAAAGFGLTSDSFPSLTGKMADALGTANDHQSGAKRRAEDRQAPIGEQCGLSE